MIWFALGFVVGVVFKVVVQWPALDDKVRALWTKFIGTKAPP